MGTELDRRGVDTTLPLWSARALLDAPEVVREIHRDYAVAGAQLHTANSFRTNPRTLERAGLGTRVETMVEAAVRLCREGIALAELDRSTWVLGSLAPVEDCYRPDQVPDDEALRVEHAAHASLLAGAGVDGFLVETMCTVRECVAAVAAARDTGLPVVASVVCRVDGNLLSGESWEDLVVALEPHAPDALMVNCTGLPGTVAAIPRLRAAWPGRWGASVNVGSADPVVGWAAGADLSLDTYVAGARVWWGEEAAIVGSCCGTNPAWTRGLRAVLDDSVS